MPFTDKQVNALRPRKTRYALPEPGRTGLEVRVSPHGAKSWAFRYRYRGEQKRMLFGAYPTLSLVDVRIKLGEAKKHIHDGRDPGEFVANARQALRTAPTMDHLAHEYLTRHAEKTMRPATVKEDRRILEKEILPVWRGRLAKEISRQDVMALLNDIEDRRVYVMRNRVAGVLSRLFLFGLDEGMVDASPAVQLRRLKKVGALKVEQPRSRFLSKDEIRSFWLGLDTIAIIPAMRAALKWALLTGQRRGEVTGTPRNEIDDATRLWTLPGTRTKNQREQLLPLPALALQILAEADRARIRPQPTRLNRTDRLPYDPTPSPWLFPSSRHLQPITPAAMTCAVVRHRAALGIGDATVHDLRRSMATWLSELGTPKDLVSALLNHAPKGVTDQHYNQATLLGPKREAMDMWSTWLERVIAGEFVAEDVIPISRGRRVH
ncbi:MAG: tyrosine-type recombinase/integrase [Nitrospirales bacterium]